MSQIKSYVNLANKSLDVNGLMFNILKNKDLKYLNLSKNIINDELLNIISENCKNLKVLILHFCTNFTKKGIIDLLKNCKKLEILHAHNTIINENFIKNVSSFNKKKIFWNI